MLLPSLLGAALVGGGLWQLRKRNARARERFIASFSFPDSVRGKLLERYPHLTPQQTGLVLQGLRDYFQLCRMAGKHMVAMPSQAVDVAWHEFILYTRRYQQFCRQGFGRFLHHTPNDAMPNPSAPADGIRRAWQLACRRDGVAPSTSSHIPLLFALDAQLAIADGFFYRRHCEAAPGTIGNGDTFCVSHFGCGSSGCGGDSGSSGHGGSDNSSGDSGGGDSGGGCGGGCGGGGGD